MFLDALRYEKPIERILVKIFTLKILQPYYMMVVKRYYFHISFLQVLDYLCKRMGQFKLLLCALNDKFVESYDTDIALIVIILNELMYFRR